MNVFVEPKVKHVSSSNDLLRKAILLSMFVCSFDAIQTPDDSWIDEEHLELYPYCGQMKTKNDQDDATDAARITNSKESSESYRWVVRVRRKSLLKTRKMRATSCTGTVITERLGFK